MSRIDSRAVVLVLITAVAGCADRRESRTTIQHEPDLVFVATDAHKSLDPQKISWLMDWRIAGCLYEALLVYDPKDLAIQPGVAESWTVSDDGLTYTFKIRSNARWSNGDPITAEDFVYAWRRALLPDMSADYTMLLYHIKGAEDFFRWRADQLAAYDKDPAGQSPQQLWEQARQRFAETVGVKAADEHTLIVTLHRPTPYFLELCAFVTFIPNHRATLDAITTINAKTGMLEVDPKYWSDPVRLVSNGAYVLQRHRFKQDLLLVTNDQYWNRDAMRNRAILEKVIPQPETALLAYEAGEVNWLDMPTSSSLASDLLKRNRSDVHRVSMAGMYFYNFNCNARLEDGSSNPLSDRRIRQALSMGIDRQTLVSKVTRLNQPVARTFVPVDAIADYAPPGDAGIGFDSARARELLADAGYPGGRGLDNLSILYNTGHGHEDIAQAIKRMWEKHLGVVVSLEGIEGKVFASRLKRGQFTICRASWFGDYRDPTTWLGKMVTDDGNNDCNYANPKYDAMLERAAGQLDPVQRFDILRQAEAMMLQDSPMAMIYQYVNVYLFDPTKVQGLHNNPWSIWRLEQVKVTP